MVNNKRVDPTYKKRVEEAKKFIEDNFWKQFWKQKLYEFGIIPSAALAIYWIPFWIGQVVLKVMGEELFLQIISVDGYISRADIWIGGVGFLLIIFIIIAANFSIAWSKLEERAREKYKIKYHDIDSFMPIKWLR